MKRALISIALVAALGAAACDASSTDTTLPGLGGDTSSTAAAGDPVTAGIAEVQQEMAALGDEIQNSEAANQLQGVWTDLQSDVATAAAALQTGASYDPATLQDSIDEFSDAVSALGSETAPELQSAWSRLRAMLENLAS